MNDIQLADGEIIAVKKRLRHLPNKRNVYIAEFQQQSVLIKQFIGKSRHKYFNREKKGVQQLINADINTPKLIKAIKLPKQNILIFEYLDNAISFKQLFWQINQSYYFISENQKKLIQTAIKSLSQLYQKGLYQKDLHLDNLLIQHQVIYFIDGDAITKSLYKPLYRFKQTENLALFFAQFPINILSLIPKLIAPYFKNLDPNQVILKTKSALDKRTKHFIQKLERSTSQFNVQKTEQHLLFYDRATFEEIPALKNQLFKNPSQLNNKYCVLSYSNTLNQKIWHQWVESNRLYFLNVPTAKPLAIQLSEQENINSYFIYQSIGAINIFNKFSYNNLETDCLIEQEQLINLFNLLIMNQISHGHLIANNIIWHNHTWKLIGLESTKQHENRQSFLESYQKDRQQFLNIWQHLPKQKKHFDKIIPIIK